MGLLITYLFTTYLSILKIIGLGDIPALAESDFVEQTIL